MSENYFTYLWRAKRHPDDSQIQRDLRNYVENLVDSLPDTFVEVYSGTMVSLTHPTPEMISLGDISHSLARLPRFNGHSHIDYSVARHVILVVDILRNMGASVRLQLLGWLHDMPEAYLGDVSSPLKRLLQPVYGVLEDRFFTATLSHFGLHDDWSPAEWEMLKRADLLALLVEREVLKYPARPTSHDWWFSQDLLNDAKAYCFLASRREYSFEEDKRDFLRGFNACLTACYPTAP